MHGDDDIPHLPRHLDSYPPAAPAITQYGSAARGAKLLRSVQRPEAEDRAARFEVPEARCVVAHAVDDRVRDVAHDDGADEAREVALRHPRWRVAGEVVFFRGRQPA